MNPPPSSPTDDVIELGRGLPPCRVSLSEVSPYTKPFEEALESANLVLHRGIARASERIAAEFAGVERELTRVAEAEELLKAKVSAAQAFHRRREAELDAREGALEDMLRENNEDRLSNRLTRELAQMALASLREEYAATSAVITNSATKVQEREDAIAQAEAAHGSLDERARGLDAREEALKAAEATHAEAEADLSVAKIELQERLDRAARDAAAREDILARREADLLRREQALKEAEEGAKQRAAELSAAEEKAKQRAAELERREAELNRRTREAKQQSEKLEAREKQVAQREQTHLEKSRELRGETEEHERRLKKFEEDMGELKALETKLQRQQDKMQEDLKNFRVLSVPAASADEAVAQLIRDLEERITNLREETEVRTDMIISGLQEVLEAAVAIGIRIPLNQGRQNQLTSCATAMKLLAAAIMKVPAEVEDLNQRSSRSLAEAMAERILVSYQVRDPAFDPYIPLDAFPEGSDAEAAKQKVADAVLGIIDAFKGTGIKFTLAAPEPVCDDDADAESSEGEYEEMDGDYDNSPPPSPAVPPSSSS